jgi:trehalose synthase
MNELGLVSYWDVIRGGRDFFHVTKTFHNALHGKKVRVYKRMFEIYNANTEMNLETTRLNGDVIIIHDPQPAGLIRKREDGQKWVWRCHIDVSNPHPKVWNFLKHIVTDYDASIFSAPAFAKELPIRQFLIPPSIDPLSDKNRELPREQVNEIITDFGIDIDRPIVTQISRFDRLKDPIGVIEAFKIARRSVDCQLVLAGGGAADDPEGAEVLEEVKEKAGDHKDIHILENMQSAPIEVNALQTGSTIVMQKSIKEGFGLTVTEALWKKRPVIAGAAGGILLQVKDNVTGMLVRSVEGAAYAIRYLLTNPDFAARLGENGHQHVKQNFLITRHLKEYLLLLLAVQNHDKGLVYV